MSAQPLPEPLAPVVPAAAFEEFWHRVYAPLLRWVAKAHGSTDVDEVVQETMVRSYENWHRLDPDRDVWPWLVVVARHVATDQLRARARRETLETTMPYDDVDPCRPDDLVCDREARDVVRAAMARLSEPDRAVLALHHVDGFPTAEIAHLTGRTDNAVRQHLFRARHRLAVQYRRLSGGSLGLAPLWQWLRRAARRVDASGITASASMASYFAFVAAVTVTVAGIAGGLTGSRPAVRGILAADNAVDSRPDFHPVLARTGPALVVPAVAPPSERSESPNRSPIPPNPIVKTTGNPITDPGHESSESANVPIVGPVENYWSKTPGYGAYCTTLHVCPEPIQADDVLTRSTRP